MAPLSPGLPRWSGIPQEQFDKTITKNLELSNAFVKKGISLEISSNLETSYIAFNMRDPILGRNKYLRQALSLAYDSDLYNEIYLNGRAINAQGPLPPGLFGYDPSSRTPTKSHDLTKARELLAKAGYPGGVDARTGKQLELTYDISSDSAIARESATFDMRCFEQLGIGMKLQVNTFSQYLERSIKGTFQMSSGAWLADYPDPGGLPHAPLWSERASRPQCVGFFEPGVRQALRADESHGGYAGTGGPDPQDGGHRRGRMSLDIQLPLPFLRAAPFVAQERQVPQHIRELREVPTGRAASEGGLLEGRRTSPTSGRPSTSWAFWSCS